MAEEKAGLIELFKYPVTVFSILIALIIARSSLGITFGTVSEVGPNGVKFAQDAKGEIADLAGKLNGAIVAIEELKKQSGQRAPSSQAQTAIFEASQTVSDQTAQLTKLSSDQAAGTSKQKGFLWVGDYKNGWSRVKLGTVDTGQPVSSAPDKLLPGTEYTVLGNMVIRDGLPSNDIDYFRGRKSLGVVPRGTKVRLVKSPVPIDRGFVAQYWTEVELL